MRLQTYITEKKEDSEKTIELIKKNCGPFLKELKQTGKKQFLYRGYETVSGTITKKRSRNDRRPRDMDETTSEYLDDLFKRKFGWFARSAGIFAISKRGDTIEYGTPYLFFPIGKYKYIWSPSVDDLYTKINDRNLSLEDDFLENYENHWNAKYGEYSGNGTWKYNDIEIEQAESESEVMIEVMKNQKLFGIKDCDDFNWSLIEFIPNITLEEYVEIEEDKQKEKLKDLISSYINKKLKQAIDFGSEITFSCKEYYLVDETLKDVLAKEFF